jgi:iron complex transport system substrate-binding protein
MRIVSLVPAATEILCEIGLADELVGISADSDWPPDLPDIPHATRADPDADPAVGSPARLVAVTHGIIPGLVADLPAIAALAPDLVVTQSRCRACGVLVRPVGPPGALSPAITVLDLEATSIEGILNAITTVGAMTEAEDEAVDFVESLRVRLGVIEEAVERRRITGRRARRVVALQRLQPPASAGHWLPEQIRRAGGWEVLGEAGGPSAETTWDAIAEVDPEVLLLVPADLRINVARTLWSRAPRPGRLDDIAAIRSGQFFLLDSPYFSRPGPRAIDGIELLAEVLDPDGFIETSPPGSWTPLYLA